MSHSLRVRPNLEILLNPQSHEQGNEKSDRTMPLSLSRLLIEVGAQAAVSSGTNPKSPERATAAPSASVAVSESTNIDPALISSQNSPSLTTNCNHPSDLSLFTADDTAHLEVYFAYPPSNPDTQDASTRAGEPQVKSNADNKENVQWSFIGVYTVRVNTQALY